jgi:hypothetical protein
MNNSLEYDITLNEDDKNCAYLSFKTPIGEVDNIEFSITSDIVVDGMECLADHLKIMVEMEREGMSSLQDKVEDTTSTQSTEETAFTKALNPAIGYIVDIEYTSIALKEPARKHFVCRLQEVLRDGYIVFGHPWNPETRSIDCGGMSDTASDITIKKPKEEDVDNWRIETLKFMIESAKEDFRYYIADDCCYEDVTRALHYRDETILWSNQEKR